MTSADDGQLAIKRLWIHALLLSIGATLACWLHPLCTSLSESTTHPLPVAISVIFGQSLLLMFPGLITGLLLARRWPTLGLAAGSAICSAVCLFLLLDAICFGWTHQHVLSDKVWRAFTVRETLWRHLNRGTIIFLGKAMVALMLCLLMIGWLSKRIASKHIDSSKRSFMVAATLVVLFSAVVSLIGTHGQPSPRFPWAGLGSMGATIEVKETVAAPAARFGYAAEMQRRLRDRDQRQLSLTVHAKRKELPDVVIVVIESFRPELVDPAVMPTLHRYAEKGLYCRNHFSTGNATTHGMFGLLNGLESIWYTRPVRTNPILNRLFQDAGYEIGFFAAHNDWAKFKMQGFISPKHYDVFETERPNWLQSDRAATENALRFLQRDDLIAGESTRPRLAVLYLYSTHANYHSYAKDQVFRPAADDRFIIPFSKEAVPSVWNRYKNSARSVDGFLSAILSEERVAIVTGDHGEAFLEDGTCGHGTRISRYQNMTPAVVYVPDRSAKTIKQPTSHADLLPTLLSAAGLSVSDPHAMDGLDLLSADTRLSSRMISTRDYLSEEFALIGNPVSRRHKSAFAIRHTIRLSDFQSTALGAIDDKGDPIVVSLDDPFALIDQWLDSRLGVSAKE